MGLADQLFEILFRAIVRIDSVIILHGIRAANGSLLLLLANRMNRHQPENVDAEIFQAIELRRNSFEISFLRKVARKDLIDNAVANPGARGPSRLFGEVPGWLLGDRMIRTRQQGDSKDY